MDAKLDGNQSLARRGESTLSKTFQPSRGPSRTAWHDPGGQPHSTLEGGRRGPWARPRGRGRSRGTPPPTAPGSPPSWSTGAPEGRAGRGGEARGHHGMGAGMLRAGPQQKDGPPGGILDPNRSIGRWGVWCERRKPTRCARCQVPPVSTCVCECSGGASAPSNHPLLCPRVGPGMSCALRRTMKRGFRRRPVHPVAPSAATGAARKRHPPPLCHPHILLNPPLLCWCGFSSLCISLLNTIHGLPM